MSAGFGVFFLWARGSQEVVNDSLKLPLSTFSFYWPTGAKPPQKKKHQNLLSSSVQAVPTVPVAPPSVHIEDKNGGRSGRCNVTLCDSCFKRQQH